VGAIQDFVGDAQAFDGLSFHDVRFDNFFDVLGADTTIKTPSG
jgi:hypothetical protein